MATIGKVRIPTAWTSLSCHQPIGTVSRYASPILPAVLPSKLQSSPKKAMLLLLFSE
jgi:hypothetical protein